MTDDVEPGLRERKRLATRRAILLATLELIERDGLDAVTVDEIARRADVSPRTFFNYFASKEEAFVGDGPQLPPEEVQRRFVDDRGALWDGLRELLTSSTRAALADQEIVLKRRALVKRYPELNARRIAALHHFEFDLVHLIEERLRAERPSAGDDARALGHRARFTAFLAVAALREAWMSWAEAPSGSSLLDHVHVAFAELPRLIAEESAAPLATVGRPS